MGLKTLGIIVIFTQLFTQWAHGQSATVCGSLVRMDKIPSQLQDYELIRDLTLKPTADLKSFAPSQGIFVTKRDDQGRPIEAFIRVLSDNPNNVIEVKGDFNNWGANGMVRLHPDSDPHYVIGTLTNISQAMQYRLVVNGQELIDPAALVQTTPEFDQKMYGRSDQFLNSVFWDIEGLGKYTAQSNPVDLRAEPIAVSENDIFSLAKLWRFNGQVGPSNRNNTYKFIAESGIINKLKESGINAIEFLPLTASVDGDVWSHRYLSYAPFAVDSRWGTPAEFAKMVDAFNGVGIGVVLDIVPGHYAQTGNAGVRDLAPIGKQNFKKADGRALYGDSVSEWGTFRYDYENPYVRKYLIDGVINFLKYYGLSGIRIDNYGGVQSRPGGRDFLRELNYAIKAYAPATWINAESFGGENNITRRQDQNGDAATTHNSGDFFGFINEMAQKRTDEIDMNMLRGILRNPWGWQESAALNYITNHDEAANTRSGASGAYFATLVSGGGWKYVEGKTRAFAALGMFSGSFYLDMPHLRILQEGSFYNNAAIEWDNLKYDSQRHMNDFFADLTKYYTSNRAFAFQNTHPDIENHTDYENKVLSLKRIDFQTGKVIYVVINLGDRGFSNYRFGVSDMGHYKVAVDSDSSKYGGSNWLGNGSQDGLWADNEGMHGKEHNIRVPYLAPYSVTVLEKLN